MGLMSWGSCHVIYALASQTGRLRPRARSWRAARLTVEEQNCRPWGRVLAGGGGAGQLAEDRASRQATCLPAPAAPGPCPANADTLRPRVGALGGLGGSSLGMVHTAPQPGHLGAWGGTSPGTVRTAPRLEDTWGTGRDFTGDDPYCAPAGGHLGDWEHLP